MKKRLQRSVFENRCSARNAGDPGSIPGRATFEIQIWYMQMVSRVNQSLPPLFYTSCTWYALSIEVVMLTRGRTDWSAVVDENVAAPAPHPAHGVGAAGPEQHRASCSRRRPAQADHQGRQQGGGRETFARTAEIERSCCVSVYNLSLWPPPLPPLRCCWGPHLDSC